MSFEGGLGEGGARSEISLFACSSCRREEGGDAEQADVEDAHRDQDLVRVNGGTVGAGAGAGLERRRNDE